MRRVSRPPNGCRVIFPCTIFVVFDTSRSTAPKLAPGSLQSCDKCKCYIKKDVLSLIRIEKG